MKNIFLTSDTHFTHQGVCKFINEDGSKLRPWDNVEEMDEYMIQAWNETVKPTDKVYHLGDVVINRKALPLLKRLNGDKVLIRGNHDIFRDSEYREYFRELRAYHVLNGMIFSHIPIHTDSLGRFGVNIHGHTHSNRVKAEFFGEYKIDVRYHCVCVEQTDFKPISIDEVIERVTLEGGSVNFTTNGNR